MKLSIHQYQLPWNADFSRSHSGLGALLALEVNGTLGYADLHPWPSNGDLALDEQLRLLQNHQPTQQTKLSLQMAERDAVARQRQIAGVRYQPRITNHYLFLESQLNLALVEARIPKLELRNGVCIAKWKLRPELAKESAEFLNLVTRLYPFLKWRLDANSLFSAEQILEFWQQLKTAAQLQIDFIEDPCPYDPTDWQRLETRGIPLAIDFEISRWQQYKDQRSPTASGQTTFILKPAVQEMSSWGQFLTQNPHPFLLTSYLDHPVGMLHALWWAETFAEKFPTLLKPCGLNLGFSPESLRQHFPQWALHQGEDNAWTEENSERIKTGVLDGGLDPKTWGIGLTPYLEGLEWHPLPCS